MAGCELNHSVGIVSHHVLFAAGGTGGVMSAGRRHHHHHTHRGVYGCSAGGADVGMTSSIDDDDYDDDDDEAMRVESRCGAGSGSAEWVTLSKTLLLQLVERICQLSFQQPEVVAQTATAAANSQTMSAGGMNSISGMFGQPYGGWVPGNVAAQTQGYGVGLFASTPSAELKVGPAARAEFVSAAQCSRSVDVRYNESVVAGSRADDVIIQPAPMDAAARRTRDDLSGTASLSSSQPRRDSRSVDEEPRREESSTLTPAKSTPEYSSRTYCESYCSQTNQEHNSLAQHAYAVPDIINNNSGPDANCNVSCIIDGPSIPDVRVAHQNIEDQTAKLSATSTAVARRLSDVVDRPPTESDSENVFPDDECGSVEENEKRWSRTEAEVRRREWCSVDSLRRRSRERRHVTVDRHQKRLEAVGKRRFAAGSTDEDAEARLFVQMEQFVDDDQMRFNRDSLVNVATGVLQPTHHPGQFTCGRFSSPLAIRRQQLLQPWMALNKSVVHRIVDVILLTGSDVGDTRATQRKRPLAKPQLASPLQQQPQHHVIWNPAISTSPSEYRRLLLTSGGGPTMALKDGSQQQQLSAPSPTNRTDRLSSTDDSERRSGASSPVLLRELLGPPLTVPSVCSAAVTSRRRSETAIINGLASPEAGASRTVGGTSTAAAAAALRRRRHRSLGRAAAFVDRPPVVGCLPGWSSYFWRLGVGFSNNNNNINNTQGIPPISPCGSDAGVGGLLRLPGDVAAQLIQYSPSMFPPQPPAPSLFPAPLPILDYQQRFRTLLEGGGAVEYNPISSRPPPPVPPNSISASGDSGGGIQINSSERCEHPFQKPRLDPNLGCTMPPPSATSQRPAPRRPPSKSNWVVVNKDDVCSLFESLASSMVVDAPPAAVSRHVRASLDETALRRLSVEGADDEARWRSTNRVDGPTAADAAGRRKVRSASSAAAFENSAGSVASEERAESSLKWKSTLMRRVRNESETRTETTVNSEQRL